MEKKIYRKSLEPGKIIGIKSLNISQLRVDTYQRDWDPQLSKEIASKMNEGAICIFPVSLRDGAYWLIDGQHRVKALEILGYPTVKCEIRTGLTKEQEANLFYLMNFNKKPQKVKDKMNALVENGSDYYVRLVEITNKEGYTFSLNSVKDHNRGKINVGAPETLKRAYDTLGADKFTKMLRLARQTWGDDRKAISSSMISGMVAFLKRYNDELIEEEFVKRLCGRNPAELERKGNWYKDDDGVGVAIARQLLKCYNQGYRKHTLPDKFYTVTENA